MKKKERWSLDKSEKEWEKTVHCSGEEWRKTVTMRVIVIELLIHLCWFPIVSANYYESEGGVPSEEEVMLWLPKVFADYQVRKWGTSYGRDRDRVHMGREGSRGS